MSTKNLSLIAFTACIVLVAVYLASPTAVVQKAGPSPDAYEQLYADDKRMSETISQLQDEVRDMPEGSARCKGAVATYFKLIEAVDARANRIKNAPTLTSREKDILLVGVKANSTGLGAVKFGLKAAFCAGV